MYLYPVLRVSFLVLACLWLVGPFLASAHSGRTNAQGCHAGKQPYHCHNAKPAPSKSSASAPARLSTGPNEDAFNDAFCKSVGGVREVRHTYTWENGRSHVIVDCETDTAVYEGGLDKRSSLDSLQQALFFAVLTGKRPVVVIYDTDGKVGRFEHRIKSAADRAGVEYKNW